MAQNSKFIHFLLIKIDILSESICVQMEFYSRNHQAYFLMMRPVKILNIYFEYFLVIIKVLKNYLFQN
jgi:hypothetical protein